MTFSLTQHKSHSICFLKVFSSNVVLIRRTKQNVEWKILVAWKYELARFSSTRRKWSSAASIQRSSLRLPVGRCSLSNETNFWTVRVEIKRRSSWFCSFRSSIAQPIGRLFGICDQQRNQSRIGPLGKFSESFWRFVFYLSVFVYGLVILQNVTVMMKVFQHKCRSFVFLFIRNLGDGKLVTAGWTIRIIRWQTIFSITTWLN